MPTYYSEDYEELVANGAVLGTKPEAETKIVAAPKKTKPKASTVAEVK